MAHHASGFGVYNDPAIAITWLLGQWSIPHWVGLIPGSASRARTRRLISSRMGRTAAMPSPAGSGRSQSR